VRFGFWGAEELGLLGSKHYVTSLSFDEQQDIALYLNFDMIGSPNAGYFVYDGDDSDKKGSGPGPYGSAQIEKDLAEHLASQGVAAEGTDFDGRSDYGGFIEAGIPAGGLFTGAEGIKTAAQAEKWGGEADKSYDPFYHSAQDNLGNINGLALARNAKCLGWVVGSYALSTEAVNGVGSLAGNGLDNGETKEKKLDAKKHRKTLTRARQETRSDVNNHRVGAQ
jgi:Zn-dependent M28 family amino/carboxypeptidase